MAAIKTPTTTYSYRVLVMPQYAVIRAKNMPMLYTVLSNIFLPILVYHYIRVYLCRPCQNTALQI